MRIEADKIKMILMILPICHCFASRDIKPLSGLSGSINNTLFSYNFNSFYLMNKYRGLKMMCQMKTGCRK